MGHTVIDQKLSDTDCTPRNLRKAATVLYETNQRFPFAKFAMLFNIDWNVTRSVKKNNNNSRCIVAL